jgi:xanthine dehydrogenase accessory factor
MTAAVEDFFERVAALRREGTPFAMATVVSRRGPVSSHMGDRALVFENGTMEGFVGGSCSRDVVRRQAIAALQAGEPRLVSIRPDADADPAAAEIVVEMSCGSKGAVDVYIEPFVPARTVVVIGLTPVAEALHSLATTLEYHVVRAVSAGELQDAERALSLAEFGAMLAGQPPGVRARTAVVVATQGHYDEDALATVLPAGAAYIGLVASRRRGAEVAEHLRAAGFAAEDVAQVRNPAGLDLGARHPGELALSILAEVIEQHPSPRSFATRTVTGPLAAETAIDPVCGMEVVAGPSAPSAERDGVTYWFCCDGCRSRFLAEVAG